MLPTITGSQSQPARHEVVSTLETSATNLTELRATHMICGASADGDLRRFAALQRADYFLLLVPSPTKWGLPVMFRGLAARR